jgi:hypothetical protein
MGRPVKQSGFIYFLLVEHADAVKIGWTRDKSLKTRMRHYYTYCPLNVDVLKVIPGSMLEERALHRRFVRDRIRAEWFRYSDELKAYIANL